MAWIKGEPHEGILAPDFNDVIRDNNAALEAALNAWMEFETGGTQTGHPRQGSARVYFQNTAPTARLDGEYFDSTDLGCIWIKPNSSPVNQLNFLTAADGAGNETWTPISNEIIAVLLAANRIFAGTLKSIGDFTVGDNKLTVVAQTGNTVVAGTFASTGIATLAKASLLASSDAPTTNAMIANKKYVDDQIAAIQDPAYTGGQSHTFDGGLIIKMGTVSVGANGNSTVTFGNAFPNGIVSANVTTECGSRVFTATLVSKAKNNIVVRNNDDSTRTLDWIAIGY